MYFTFSIRKFKANEYIRLTIINIHNKQLFYILHTAKGFVKIFHTCKILVNLIIILFRSMQNKIEQKQAKALSKLAIVSL